MPNVTVVEVGTPDDVTLEVTASPPPGIEVEAPPTSPVIEVQQVRGPPGPPGAGSTDGVAVLADPNIFTKHQAIGNLATAVDHVPVLFGDYDQPTVIGAYEQFGPFDPAIGYGEGLTLYINHKDTAAPTSGAQASVYAQDIAAVSDVASTVTYWDIVGSWQIGSHVGSGRAAQVIGVHAGGFTGGGGATSAIGVRANANASAGLVTDTAYGVQTTAVHNIGKAIGVRALVSGAAEAHGVVIEPTQGSAPIKRGIWQKGTNDVNVLQGVISPLVNTDVAVRVRGLVGQSGDLQEWQDYSGAPMASVDSSGAWVSTSDIFASTISVDGSGGYEANLNATVGATAYHPARPAIIARAHSGQTGNIQQWENSGGGVLASIDSVGHAVMPSGVYGGTSALTGIGTVARNAFQGNSAGDVVVGVRGFSGQAVDLTQWQNVDSLRRMAVAPNGEALTGYLSDGNTPAWQMKSGDAAGPRIYAWAFSPGVVPIVAQGGPSQTADLQQWLNNSGSKPAYVDRYGRFQVNPSNTRDTIDQYINAAMGISPRTSDTVGLAVQGLVGQTGDLQQWVDSAGAVLASAAADGSFHAFAGGSGVVTPYVQDVAQTGTYLNFSNNRVNVFGRVASQPVMAVVGASGQSEDLTIWQASGGGVLAKVTKDGYIYEGANRVYSAANPPPGGGGSPFIAASDASVPLIAKGFSPTQSADYQQWQTSTGVVSAAISITGISNQAASDPYIIAWPGAGTDYTFIGSPTSTAHWFTETIPGDGVVASRSLSSGRRLRIGPLGEPTVAATPLSLSNEATAVVAIVKGQTGQSGDLQQWQTSTPTTVAKVDAAGAIYSSALYDNGSRVAIDSAVVHNTGSETVAGTKNFTAALTVSRPTNNDAIVLFNTTDSTSGRFRPKAGGGFDFVNNAATVAVLQLTDAGALVVASTIASGGNITENGNRVYSAGNAPPYPVTSVAGRTGAIALTAADIAAGTFPTGAVTFQPVDAVFSVLGGSGHYTSIGVGRASAEVFLGISAGATNWLSDTAAGDPVVQFISGATLRIGVGNTTSTLRVTGSGAAVTGTLSSTGNLSENGNRVYSAGNAPPYPVTTVAGRTGAVVIAPSDVSGVYYSGNANLASATPAAVASAGAVGAGTDYARGNHVHAGVSSLVASTFIAVSAATGAVTPSLSATGTPGSTTFLRGDNTWAVPTGAVTSVAARTGAVTLTAADIAAGTFPAGSYAFGNNSTITIDSASTAGGMVMGDGGTAALGPEIKLLNSGNNHWSFRNATGVLQIGTTSGGAGLGLALTALLTLTPATGVVNAPSQLQENGNRVYSAGNAPPYPVTTVAGRTGAVVIAPADVSGVYYSGNANLASATPAAVASAGAVGAGTDYARGNHVHAGVASITTNTGLSSNVSATGAVTVTNTGVTSLVASTFIAVSAATGAVTPSLSATGTPSSANFLRGDNTWAPAPVTSVASRTGAVTLTAADVAAGTFPGAVTFSGAVTGGAGGYLDLGPVAGSLATLATTSAAGDKINLYDAGASQNYGFGIQASRLVAYLPAAASFAVRVAAASGQASSGTEIFTVSGAGVLNTAGNITENGTRLYSVNNKVPIAGLSATGTTDSTTFLRGDNTWAVPPTAAVTSVNTRTGAVTGLAEDSSVVHLAGTESITGAKTFTANATVSKTTPSIILTDGTTTHTIGIATSAAQIDTNSLAGDLVIGLQGSTKRIYLSNPVSSISDFNTAGAMNALGGLNDNGNRVYSATRVATMTAKGSQLVATAANTPGELPIGAEGQVQVARAAATTGIAWEDRSFAATGLGSTGNTTTETVIASFTIPAAYLLAGTVLDLKMLGQAGSTQTLTFKIRCGTAGTTADALLQTFTTTVAGVANQHAVVDALVHCLTAGTSGTAYAGGVVLYQGTTNSVYGPVTAAAVTATVNTTVQNKITVTVTNGSNTAFTSRTAILTRVA